MMSFFSTQASGLNFSQLVLKLCGAWALALPVQAWAHVKWFAPYEIAQQPVPPREVVLNPHFWAGLLLVMVCFLAATAVERSPWGARITALLDRLALPLATRMGGFVRVITGVFFVGLFARGGTYLTPDLITQDELIPWIQLIIAAAIVFQPTRLLAAAGICLLWVLALREYSLYHLLDYLPLQLGLTVYLLLDSKHKPQWRQYRFEALRISLAVTIIWSSLEKFAYPARFMPVLQDMPFLSMGMPHGMFITMAGVAEFAMGVGLLWSPFIRRLSALVIIAAFASAVIPFGRTDLIGHVLLIAIALVTFADRSPRRRAYTGLDNPYLNVPTMGVVLLTGFGLAYWGLHALLY